jgi:hypothetical protein
MAMKIEDKMKDASGRAYEYSSTVEVIPLSSAMDIAKTYAYDMVEKFKQELIDKCEITSNNHEPDISQFEIMDSKIELI